MTVSPVSLPSPSESKYVDWNNNKYKNLRDIILKVMGVVAGYVVGFGVLLGTPVLVGVVAPALAVSVILGGTIISASVLVGVCALWPCVTDWTNYRDPENVKRVLSEIKASRRPLFLSKFKTLHRYGIISKSELEQRMTLEDKAKRFEKLDQKIDKMTRKLQSQMVKIPTFPLNVERNQELLDKIEARRHRLQELQEERKAISQTFVAFHQSIVTFDPKRVSTK